MVTPQLYQQITNKVDAELLKFMDAANLINLTDVKVVDDPLIVEYIMKFLEDTAQASLSADLWDPTIVEPVVNMIALKRESCDIKEKFKYEDWKALIKMDVMDSNLSAVGEKPAIQASHRLLQGTKLVTGSVARDPRPLPRAGQYNFVIDVGADNLASTIVRPIGCNQVTGTPNTWTAATGAWSTYANMATDANQVETLIAEGFNRDTIYAFYPKIATPGMGKKRTTAGDGFRNFYMEMEDHGISRDRVIGIDDRYMWTVAGAAPTLAAHDIYYIDMKSIRTIETVAPFVNSYVDTSGTRFPEMTVEAGLTMIPIFKPKYNPGSGKWRKGVSIVRAVNST